MQSFTLPLGASKYLLFKSSQQQQQMFEEHHGLSGTFPSVLCSFVLHPGLYDLLLFQGNTAAGLIKNGNLVGDVVHNRFETNKCPEPCFTISSLVVQERLHFFAAGKNKYFVCVYGQFKTGNRFIIEQGHYFGFFYEQVSLVLLSACFL